VNIEYGGVVVQWVWGVVVVACVSYGMSRYGVAYAHRCREVCSVLRDRVVGWWVCRKNCLLQCLEIVGYSKLAPRAPLEHSFGEGGAFEVRDLPRDGEMVD
jgi:hypothetical protein